MQRRTLLRRSAGLGAIALAGCASDGGNGGGNGDDSDGTDGDSSGPTGFPDYGVETTGSDCAGDDAGTADVSFDGDALSVTIEGLIETPDPCHEARLEGINYDGDADQLRITISARDDDSGACQQCVGQVSYEATVEVSGALPGTVVVRHRSDGETTEVASVSND